MLNHIFVSGSLAAMAAYAAVAIGSWIGIRGENFYKRHPSLAFNSALTASLVIWLMVRIAG